MLMLTFALPGGWPGDPDWMGTLCGCVLLTADIQGACCGGGEWRVVLGYGCEASLGCAGQPTVPLCPLSPLVQMTSTFPAPASSAFPRRIAPKQPQSKQKPPS